MTKLQQHRHAMKHGGLSPFFGAIANGHVVTPSTKVTLAPLPPLSVTAGGTNAGANRAIDRGAQWWSA